MTAISSWDTYKAYRGADATLADLNDDLTDGIISRGTFLAVTLSYERGDKHRRDIREERKAELFHRGLLKKKKLRKLKRKVKRIKKALTEEQKHRRAIRKAEERQERRFKNVQQKAL